MKIAINFWYTYGENDPKHKKSNRGSLTQEGLKNQHGNITSLTIRMKIIDKLKSYEINQEDTEKLPGAANR